eukprot:scaffold158839_cov38-Prasinocladus_malaysianus.AAC.1
MCSKAEGNLGRLDVLPAIGTDIRILLCRVLPVPDMKCTYRNRRREKLVTLQHSSSASMTGCVRSRIHGPYSN